MKEGDAVDERLHLARQTKMRYVGDLRVGEDLKGAYSHRDALSQRWHIQLVVKRLLRFVVIKNLR